jgi:hypothetical protein
MSLNPRPLILLSLLAYLLSLVARFQQPGEATAGPRQEGFWRVEELRPGLKGYGRTVLKGTQIESFQAEVLGILKNTSPGRDLVLCRLSGLDLDKTGVIAGMSGSPVYIQGRLLGAVAYAWPYGKEPIAGITPFCEMCDYVDALTKADDAGPPVRVPLDRPLKSGGRQYDSVNVAQRCDTPHRDDDGLWLVPLQTPLVSSGLTQHTLHLLRDRAGDIGLLPVQGGSVSAGVLSEAGDVTLRPGSPMAVALITGDFDLSGIGTVTHIENKRVYGWGHPFLSLGACELPLMTGYIHTVYPRQTVSFKMGSPLKVVGSVFADVSTGIAGRMGPAPEMMPIRMSVALGSEAPSRTFNVRTARQRSLLPSLVYTALTNSVDMQGDLPEEMTAEFKARIEMAGHEPIVISDTFSGLSGGRAPGAMFGPVAALVGQLVYNPYEQVTVERIDCQTRILPGRRSADIEAVELDSDAYAPGDLVKAAVFVRPFKGQRRKVTVTMRLPEDLPEGTYSASVCDGLANARNTLRDNPTLANPTDIDQVIEGARLLVSGGRTHLVLRVPTGPTGVAADGKAMPDLPASMVHILANGRRTGAQAITGALVAETPTEWVLQGSETVRLTVTRDRRATRGLGDER